MLTLKRAPAGAASCTGAGALMPIGRAQADSSWPRLAPEVGRLTQRNPLVAASIRAAALVAAAASPEVGPPGCPVTAPIN